VGEAGVSGVEVGQWDGSAVRWRMSNLQGLKSKVVHSPRPLQHLRWALQRLHVTTNTTCPCMQKMRVIVDPPSISPAGHDVAVLLLSSAVSGPASDPLWQRPGRQRLTSMLLHALKPVTV
jgi:hypothetical protein